MLEAVPNVSEGRDAAVISAIGAAFAKHAALLDVHSDPDHHRSVFTVAGEDDDLVESLLAGIGTAVELVDLREHSGVHPRIGVADVVPLVPLEPAHIEAAAAAARALAHRIGSELGLPVFLYGEVGAERRPAFFRRGGLDELVRRVSAGELVPNEGPHAIDPRAGVALVGARHALVAYNLDLDTKDVSIAMAIAAAVRESSGGMPGLQALGLELTGSGRLQVSMNVIDLDRAPVHEVVERVRREAADRRVEVVAGELVGLVPERVVAEAAAAGVTLPGIDDTKVLERILGSRVAEWPERSS